jgi:hypothetical protein
LYLAVNFKGPKRSIKHFLNSEEEVRAKKGEINFAVFVVVGGEIILL